MHIRRVLLKTLWEPSWWLKDREPACDAGDEGLIPGWGRSPGEGNGNPRILGRILARILGNFHGQRRLAGYSPWGHKESDMTKLLSMYTCMGFLVYCFQPVHGAAASARDLVRSYYARDMVWGNWPPGGRYRCPLLPTTVFRLPLTTHTHTHTHACTLYLSKSEAQA